MKGTLINAGAIIVGSLLGIAIHSRLPKRIITRVFQGLGLFALFIGTKMALETNNLMIMIFSIVIGSIIGEFIDIDKGVTKFSIWLKNKIKSKNENFSEGLITAFLISCMGSLSILGSFEEGLGHGINLLLTKSILDGFTAVALAASFGIGVLFSVIPVIIYQGGLTLFAGLLQNFLTTPIITELTAVGGLLLIGLGINILEIKKLKIMNMIPSLIVAVGLAYFFL